MHKVTLPLSLFEHCCLNCEWTNPIIKTCSVSCHNKIIKNTVSAEFYLFAVGKNRCGCTNSTSTNRKSESHKYYTHIQFTPRQSGREFQRVIKLPVLHILRVQTGHAVSAGLGFFYVLKMSWQMFGQKMQKEKKTYQP